MTKLTKTELKAKVEGCLKSKGIPLDAAKCAGVIDKCKDASYTPETEEERWILQQLKKTGVVVRDFTYKMVDGFDDEPDKEEAKKE